LGSKGDKSFCFSDANIDISR